MKSDMRVLLTKRLLKEGLLCLLKETPISRITITDLCRVSGVNRATFYKHYETPVMILREIAYDYAASLKEVFSQTPASGQDIEAKVIACLSFLMEKKEDIKLLYSPNAENYLSGFMMEIVNDFVISSRTVRPEAIRNVASDEYLPAVLTASAAVGLIQTWLVRDIPKTPQEIVDILKKTFGPDFLQQNALFTRYGL